MPGILVGDDGSFYIVHGVQGDLGALVQKHIGEVLYVVEGLGNIF